MVFSPNFPWKARRLSEPQISNPDPSSEGADAGCSEIERRLETLELDDPSLRTEIIAIIQPQPTRAIGLVNALKKLEDMAEMLVTTREAWHGDSPATIISLLHASLDEHAQPVDVPCLDALPYSDLARARTRAKGFTCFYPPPPSSRQKPSAVPEPSAPQSSDAIKPCDDKGDDVKEDEEEEVTNDDRCDEVLEETELGYASSSSDDWDDDEDCYVTSAFFRALNNEDDSSDDEDDCTLFESASNISDEEYLADNECSMVYRSSGASPEHESILSPYSSSESLAHSRASSSSESDVSVGTEISESYAYEALLDVDVEVMDSSWELDGTTLVSEELRNLIRTE